MEIAPWESPESMDEVKKRLILDLVRDYFGIHGEEMVQVIGDVVLQPRVMETILEKFGVAPTRRIELQLRELARCMDIHHPDQFLMRVRFQAYRYMRESETESRLPVVVPLTAADVARRATTGSAHVQLRPAEEDRGLPVEPSPAEPRRAQPDPELWKAFIRAWRRARSRRGFCEFKTEDGVRVIVAARYIGPERRRRRYDRRRFEERRGAGGMVMGDMRSRSDRRRKFLGRRKSDRLGSRSQRGRPENKPDTGTPTP